jgi:hypothetical protein
MKFFKPFLASIALAFVFVAISAALPVQTQPQPTQAQQASDKFDGECTGNETVGRCADKPLIFSHENCQYPDRWSNPVDGCDNSDPAVPECIKAFSTKEGEDACIAAFVAAQQPNPAQPPQAAQCGGK